MDRENPSLVHDRRTMLKTTSGVLLTGGLAGCSQNSGSEGSEVDSGEQPDPLTRPDLGYGGQVLQSGNADPGFNDPAVDVEGVVNMNVYDTLLMENGDHEIVPHLASDLEQPNPSEIELTIRDGVQFHSGNELTAEDARYTFERILELEGPRSTLISNYMDVDGLSAPDDKTFVIELTEPWLQVNAVTPSIPIVDSELVKENEQDGDYGHNWLSENFAGCGPYQVSDWDNSDYIEFERFEDYWGGWDHDEPIERFRGDSVEEDSTIIQMWQNNNAHITGENLQPQTIERLAEDDNTTWKRVETIQQWTFNFNTQDEPYDDVNVRNAIDSAVDYESAQPLVAEGSTPAAGPVPKKVPGWNDEIPEAGPSNFEAAQDHIDNSDYTVDEINAMGGMPFHQYRDTGPVRRVPLLFQDNLSEIGIESTIRNVTFPEIVESTESPDDAIGGWGGNYRGGGSSPASPDAFLYQGHHSSSLGNDFYTVHWYENEELDTVLEEMRAAESREASFERAAEAQQMLMDAQPVLWVSNPVHNLAMREEIADTFTYRGTVGQRWYAYDWDWDSDAV